MTTEKKELAQKETRVLLAHSVRLVRESMASVLKGGGFKLVGDVDNEADLVRLAIRYNPDILLMDWAVPKSPVDTVIHLSEERNYKGAVVLLGYPESLESIVDVLQAGARGCLSLDLPGAEFIYRLGLLAQGDILVSRELTSALSQQWVDRTLDETTDGLSDREREVLALVSTGATNKEIAQQLTVTENTVKVHLRHILDKLDLRNRQQLAVYAVREGLVEEDSDEAEAGSQTTH